MKKEIKKNYLMKKSRVFIYKISIYSENEDETTEEHKMFYISHFQILQISFICDFNLNKPKIFVRHRKKEQSICFFLFVAH